MRRAILVLILLPVAALAGEPKGDLRAMQGRWTARLGTDGSTELTWTIAGDRLTARIHRPDGSEVVTTCTLKLDEKAVPKAMDQAEMTVDFVGAEGKLKAEDSLAIYEVAGDSLKVCIAPVGQGRPGAFVDGERSSLVRLKRAKDARP
jgi:uncharacterized protein (TIGR03067 family)